MGQGRENSKNFIREHPELALEIEGKLKDILQPPAAEPEEPAEPEAQESPEEEVKAEV